MSKVQLHPDVVAIKRAAPKWANWFVVTVDGDPYWQTHRGTGGLWWMGLDNSDCKSVTYSQMSKPHGYAISLKTGTVHLLGELVGLGKIVAVPQSAWVAARKRKGRKRWTA